MSDDPIARFPRAALMTFSEWQAAIASTIPTEEMLDWFGAVLDGQVEARRFFPWSLNAYCAAQERFRELAHFSRRLTPEQRRLFIDEADMIVGLIRDFWGGDSALMQRLDLALAASADRFSRFGWPSPAWELVSFEEL